MSILNALTASQARNNGPVSPEQEKYESLVRANDALSVLGLGLPTGVGMGLQALTDMQIDALEKQNPSLAPRDPFDPRARNRFSTVGQVVFGYGYPTQVGIPSVSLVDRIRGVLGGDNALDPRTTIWNARGVPMFTGGPTPYQGGGWETGGGGDGPSGSSNTYNFGGRESSIGMDDRSGYA